jgi:hypothetical protein
MNSIFAPSYYLPHTNLNTKVQKNLSMFAGFQNKWVPFWIFFITARHWACPDTYQCSHLIWKQLLLVTIVSMVVNMSIYYYTHQLYTWSGASSYPRAVRLSGSSIIWANDVTRSVVSVPSVPWIRTDAPEINSTIKHVYSKT